MRSFGGVALGTDIYTLAPLKETDIALTGHEAMHALQSEVFGGEVCWGATYFEAGIVVMTDGEYYKDNPYEAQAYAFGNTIKKITEDEKYQDLMDRIEDGKVLEKYPEIRKEIWRVYMEQFDAYRLQHPVPGIEKVDDLFLPMMRVRRRPLP